jgi:hypothetical protein
MEVLAVVIVRVFGELTTKAQQSGARHAWIANHDAMPGSLQPMVKKPGHR